MTTPDTSVVVAAFARWHERHEEARGELPGAKALVGHVALEAYSVLTRLPAPRRTPPRLALDFLEHHFPGPALTLDAAGYPEVLAEASEHGIVGGAVYDAVVAATARRARATLVTLDVRAAATYRALGAEYRLIS